MQHAPSEVLLQVFKTMQCQERLKAREINNRWSEIIDDNKSLWRSAVYPQLKQEWSDSLLELHDKSSRSRLEEIHFISA